MAGPYPYYFLPLGEIIDDLRAQGFRVGVDTYADLYRLLSHRDFQALNDPHRACTILCPLFATTPEEQDIFYRTFWKHAQPPAPQIAPPPRPTRAALDADDAKMIIRYFLIAIIAITFVTIGLYTYFTLNPVMRKIDFTTNPKPFDTVDTAKLFHPAPIDTAMLTPPPHPKATLPPAHQLNYLPIYDPDPSYYRIDNFWSFRLRQYGVQIGLWIVMVLGVCGIVYMVYRSRRERLLLDKRQQLSEPAEWPVHVPERLPVTLPPLFYAVGNHLRQRIQSSSEQIDVNASIIATLRKGGYPTPVFRRHSRPAEYVLLIEERSTHAMLPAYLDFLFREFGKTDIIVHRFAWRASPSQPIDPLSGKTMSLPWLLYHFGDSRLIICGNSAPIATDPAVIENGFSSFADRAVLLYDDPDRDSPQALALSAQFRMAPASLSGLRQISLQWETEGSDSEDAGETISTNMLREGDPSRMAPLLLDYFERCNTGTRPELLLRWMAGCCFYPELHWELLLFVGRMLSTEEENLITLENLEALVRVPGMANGRISDYTRQALIQDDSIFPGNTREELVRAITKLLRENLPDEKKSQAWQERMLHIVAMESMLTVERKKRRTLLRELKHYSEITNTRDAVVMRILDRRSLGRFLPEQLKQALYRDGLPYRGWRTAWSGAALLLVAALITSLLDFSPFYGNIETRESASYFINSAEKQANWFNHLAAFYYNPQTVNANPSVHRGIPEHESARQYIDSALRVAPNDAITRYNLQVRELNYDFIEVNEDRPAQALNRIENSWNSIRITRRRIEQAVKNKVPGADSVSRRMPELMNHARLAEWLSATRLQNKEKAAEYYSQIDTALLSSEDKQLIEAEK